MTTDIRCPVDARSISLYLFTCSNISHLCEHSVGFRPHLRDCGRCGGPYGDHLFYIRNDEDQPEGKHSGTVLKNTIMCRSGYNQIHHSKLIVIDTRHSLFRVRKTDITGGDTCNIWHTGQDNVCDESCWFYRAVSSWYRFSEHFKFISKSLPDASFVARLCFFICWFVRTSWRH